MSSSRSLPILELSADEMESLSEVLDLRMAEGGADKSRPEQWVLIGAASDEEAAVVRKTMRAVGQIARRRLSALTEENIEHLVDMYLAGHERSDVDVDLELDNAEIRAEYLRATKTLTAKDVRAAVANKPKNPSEPASRWKREKRIFAVRNGGVDLFPHFLFRDGAPRKGIKKILEALPEDMSPWQIALWFASGNGWLGDKAPQDCLDDVSLVVDAAKRMNDTAIG